jgi:hypothetical protein
MRGGITPAPQRYPQADAAHQTADTIERCMMPRRLELSSPYRKLMPYPPAACSRSHAEHLSYDIMHDREEDHAHAKIV